MGRLRVQAMALVGTAMGGLLLAAGVAAQAPEDAGTFGVLLQAVPAATERSVQIWINDYAAAAEALGIARPGPEAADDAVEAYLLALDRGGVAAGPYISGFHTYARTVLPGLRQRAGYDVRDVRGSLQDLASVPARRAAVLLALGGGTVREAILSSAAWPAPLTWEHRGVDFLVWDPVFSLNLEQRLHAPVFDELGRAAPLAFMEEGILSASSVEETEAMIDAHLNHVHSLWDVDVVRSLAEGLAGFGAYSCMLTDDPSSQSTGEVPASEETQLSEGADAPLALRPYQALGLGIGEDADGFYMVLVLAHADAVAANENAAILPTRFQDGRSVTSEAPWSTWFDVERVSLELDGPMLSAKVPLLPATSASMWIRWFLERDPLLLYR